MANNLIFPIGFDLESGVQDAIKKGDAALRQIEAAMNRKPIVLRAEVDANKFQMFSRQFTNSIDGISAKLAQAQRIWNSMSFDVKFDSDGNLSRRAQIVFDAFQQLTQASATMGQRLGEVNRNLAKSEADTARAITAEYNKRQQLINEQIRLKERQAAAEERVRQSQLKGVNVGYVDTQKQVEAVRNLRLQYEAILPMLNAMAQRRVEIRVGIDRQFEPELKRLDVEVNRTMAQIQNAMAKGVNTDALRFHLQKLNSEINNIRQQKIDIFNNSKINADLSRLRTEISSVFGELQNAERKLAADNSLNSALDTQSQKVLKLHADIQKLDQQIAQLNAQGKMYNADGSFSTQAISILQQRIALTKQLEQEAITGQQAQIRLEQQLREEKRKTEQEAKNAAKEAERQAKAEAAARKQAQDAANAENKARQEAYNARRRQGQETQRILNKEAKSIADITAKLQIQQQRLQSANIGSAKFNKIAEEVKRLTADLEKANQKMRELTGHTQSGAARQSAAVRQVNQEFQNQDGYVSRLLKRLAVYASFSYTTNFLTSIREATAQFELQRVSLGAIIQDQSRANQLWAEIKTFALKSPVKILDLTKYTKQVAAYGVETDKLFDTTKRIMDISVGLGVDASRLVLAYGQVKAASYLRAAEIRQFTEAGIPMLELLAKKFTELNGKAVTTEQVMDMVSKRMVGFDMVEQIFKDMTSAGGMFFDMQEKQGNTLYGLWAKLGDAASVMYDQIGNTSTVNSGMKEAIRLLSDLMRNWRNVGLVVAESAAVFAIWKSQAVNAALVTNALTAAEVRALAVKKVHYKMQPAIIRGIIGETNARKLSIITVRAHAAAVRASATSTNIFTKAWHSLKAAFLSNPFGIALTAIAAIATYLMFADDKVKRFKEDLDSIKEGGAVEATKSAYNFEQLAEKAVNAADGSMEQKDALDELQRTYKDMIPIQDLTIEKLRALKGNYDSLTQSIKEYVYQRNLQQQIDRIIEERTGTMTRIEQKLRDELKEGVKYQVSDAVHTKDLGIDDNQISALFSRIKTEAKNTTKDVQTIIRESVDEIFGYLSQEDRNLLYAIGYNKLAGETDDFPNTLQSIIELQRAMDGEIENASTSMSQYTGYLGEYKKELDNITESVKKYRLVNTKGEAVGRDTFLFQQGQQNFKIKEWANSIKSDLESAGVTIKEGIFSLVDKINENDPTKISTIDFTKLMPMLDSPEVKQKLGNSYETFKNYVLSIQKLYDGIVPSDPIVQAVRNSMFAIGNATKVGMDVMKKHLWDGKGSIEDHLKTLKQSATTLESEIYKYSQYIKLFGTAGKNLLKMMGVDVDALTQEYDALTKQIEYVQQYIKETDEKNKGRTSDPRLQTLQEIANKMAEVNKEYDELLKKEGQTKALADTQKLFASSFADMQKVADKYKFKLPAFEVPQTIEDVQKWYDAIIKEINRLGIKNADKVLIELGFKSDKAAIDKQQKDIESELKRLADRISRTKTAKEFYEKILEQTGDINIATRVSMSIYGSTGEELFNDTVEQIREAFKTGSEEHPIDLDISAAIDLENQRIDYKKLADIYDKYQNEIIEKRRDTAKKIATEGQKEVATDILNWRKSLAKAKSYEQKRTDIINTATAERAKIIRETADPKERGELLGLSYSKQAQELAKLAVDEFKSSDDYIKVFQDLDRVSTQTLDRMKKRLEEMIATVKDTENVEGLKTLVEQLDKIKEERETRNPIEGIIDSFKEYAKARKDYRTAEAEEAAAKAEFAQQEVGLNMAIQTAKAEQAIAQQRVNDLKAQGKENTSEGVAAELALNEATKKVTQAEENRNKAVKKVNNAEQKTTDALDAQKAALAKLQKNVNAMANAFNSAASSIKAIADMMGIAEDSELGDIVNGLVDGLNNAATIMTTILAIAIAIEAACWWMLAIGAAVAAFSAIGSWLTGSKVRKANKEIERQQKLLDQLDYTYGRLEKAADKLFGADFVANQKQQQKILLAQQQAYMKQYEAEMSKGKKADKEKAQEFLDKARDVGDQIADMQGKIAEQMAGTDVASAARDFASAWLEAYASFGNTTDAIREKFNDMIKNMIVESVMAKTVQMALQPMFDEMDKMYKSGASMTDVLSYAFSKAGTLTDQISNGLEVNAKYLESLGINIRDLYASSDNLKGIAKEVGSASSEEINQLSAFVNTALYYVSPIPTISDNVAVIRQLMERGTTSTLPDTTAAGWTDWQRQAMDNYNAIARNTADTVVECRRAAVACEAATEKLNRALRAKGATIGFNVFLNS